MAKSTTILLVEDDTRLATLTADFLTRQMFDVTIEGNGIAAIAYIEKHQPDLVLLDIMLPGASGMDVCKAVRPFYSGPIIMLTAMGESLDQVLGLELGADDYIIKPIEPRVLLARVRAQLRRVNQPAQPKDDRQNSTLTFGQLSINPDSRTVTLYDQQIPMTTAEFDVLWLLASEPGKVLTRDMLLLALKGIDFDGLDRTIDIHISRLRRKLDDDVDSPQKIKTVRGKGYLLNRDGWN
ncbi:winged helix-turn-helix domain-containing protein [Edaphovirga cremea]|uniref:winged helix-turn-helix domain-containing protein n=1 Tax=Edaphovirga cremea TaxID=2267246 RepID=UPI001B866F9C|nr:winged helix-turn-helix domain-containing protein [Edaphovirga cremea]